MRILFIGIGPWNDVQSGNNILTNWFTGYSCEAAQIYVHDGLPCNKICTRYFHVTDQMMVKSFTGKRAGESFFMSAEEQLEQQKESGLHVKESTIVTHARRLPRTVTNIAKDLVWFFGRVNKEKLRNFVDDFSPDIVFCPHLFDARFWRLERLIRQYTKAPFIAFTGDAEVSLKYTNWSPLFWMRQLFMHNLFWKHIKIFSHYFTFSENLATEYHNKSGVPASTLYKCGNFDGVFMPKQVHSPIRLVYAGNLYCNRWKTISVIADSIEAINKDKLLMTLDVYTNTNLTKDMVSALAQKNGTTIHERVAPEQLVQIYADADVALHVESFDNPFRQNTKESFSTKIVDLMESSCAIMAICWEKHNGLQYLKKHDAAICVDKVQKIPEVLKELVKHTEVIPKYAKKAWECGVTNHRRSIIQKQLADTFNMVIKNSKNK